MIMDFESPDVEKDFPGLYASDTTKKSQSKDSDYSDGEKLSCKDLLGKRKDKKDSKKDKGYMAFEGESSGDEVDETNYSAKSPAKIKKNKSTYKFLSKDKKEKHAKVKEKDTKEKKDDDKDIKITRKDSKEVKKSKCKEEKKKNKNNILKIKDKKKKSSEQVVEEKPIFGVPLQEAVERSKSHDGIEIPIIVRECIDYIEEHGLACEGIYRISGVKSKVRHIKNQYNRGEKVYLYEHEPHIIAILLKQFLRDLPEPILTKELMPQFEEAGAIKNDQKQVEAFSNLIGSLPNCNRLLLSWIFVHMLHVVKLEKRNKMNLQNVSLVLSPILQVSHRVLHALFCHSDTLFKGVEIKKYIPPIEPDSSRLSLELPDSPTAIEDELGKQENLLNEIHVELNGGVRDTNKEEQLWEVQRVVTQLKRKLRFLRQVQAASKPETNQYDSVEIENECSSITSAIRKSPLAIRKSPLAIRKSPLAVRKSPLIQKEVANSDQFIGKSENEVAQELDTVSDSSDIKNQEETQVEESQNSEIIEQSAKNIENIDKANVDTSLNDQVEMEHCNDKKIEPCEEIENHELDEPSQEEVQCNSASSLHEVEKTTIEAELMDLQQEELTLQIEEDELLLSHEELKRKIKSEKQEIERLQQDILEYQKLYKYRFSMASTENSSSDSEDSSASDEKDATKNLIKAFREAVAQNALIEEENSLLIKKIQEGREECIDLKVKIKMALSDVV